MSHISEQNALSFLHARYGRHVRILADILKYGAASAAAFALDFAVLLCGLRLGFDYLAAAAAGFCSGLVLVYLLSVRFVFGDRRRLRPSHEFLGFLATGLAGLALTEALMHCFVEYAGLVPALAKIPTAGFVFLFNFTARRALLFSAGAKEAP